MKRYTTPQVSIEAEARTIATALVYCEKRLRDKAERARVNTGAQMNEVLSLNAFADRLGKLAGSVYSMCPWWGGYRDGNEIADVLGEDWE